jgi:hypothetical protein
VIIAGSRHVTSMVALEAAVWLAEARKGIKVTEVISGCAPGVDSLAIAWAEANGKPCTKIPANWASKAGGPLRNEVMAKHGEALIAVWDGITQGTRDMIDRMKARGLPVFIYRVMKPETKRKLNEGQ